MEEALLTLRWPFSPQKVSSGGLEPALFLEVALALSAGSEPRSAQEARVTGRALGEAQRKQSLRCHPAWPSWAQPSLDKRLTVWSWASPHLPEPQCPSLRHLWGAVAHSDPGSQPQHEVTHVTQVLTSRPCVLLACLGWCSFLWGISFLRTNAGHLSPAHVQDSA